MSQVCQC